MYTTATKSLSNCAMTRSVLPQTFRDIRYNSLVVLLVLLGMLSSFGFIYTKDLCRRAFVREQMLGHLARNMQIRWDRLLLEQAAISSETHMRRVIGHQLAMHTPLSSETVLVKL